MCIPFENKPCSSTHNSVSRLGSLLTQCTGIVNLGGQFLDARHDAALLGEEWQGYFDFGYVPFFK